MGTCGQVFIEDTGVYLYAHNDANKLINKVRDALAKRWRWSHPDYLTRIILDEMMDLDDFRTQTGYGIGTSDSDCKILIRINCADQVVEYKISNVTAYSVSFEMFISDRFQVQ